MLQNSAYSIVLFVYKIYILMHRYIQVHISRKNMEEYSPKIVNDSYHWEIRLKGGRVHISLYTLSCFLNFLT